MRTIITLSTLFLSINASKYAIKAIHEFEELFKHSPDIVPRSLQDGCGPGLTVCASNSDLCCPEGSTCSEDRTTCDYSVDTPCGEGGCCSAGTTCTRSPSGEYYCQRPTATATDSAESAQTTPAPVVAFSECQTRCTNFIYNLQTCESKDVQCICTKDLVSELPDCISCLNSHDTEIGASAESVQDACSTLIEKDPAFVVQSNNDDVDTTSDSSNSADTEIAAEVADDTASEVTVTSGEATVTTTATLESLTQAAVTTKKSLAGKYSVSLWVAGTLSVIAGAAVLF